MHAIGIDLGTTSICGILIDTDSGAVLRSRTENSNAFIPGQFAWERLQNPEQIITLATAILEDLMCEDVVAIGVTGQMHGIVYVDALGKAVSPLYTWQDNRGNQPYQNTTYAKFLNSHSGYGNVTDFFNRQNGLVPETAAAFCTIQDYLVMGLCGLSKPQVHITNAASFGCFDLTENRFTCPCPMEPVKNFSIAGTYRGIPVGVAIGDNQASVFSTLNNAESVLLNIGTGSQISILSSHVIEAPNIETRPYFEEQYLVVGSALCGGRAYAVLKDFYARLLRYTVDLSDAEIYDIMSTMLATQWVPLTVDTRLDGTRADESLRGSITGISPHNFTPEALTQGFLEGMVRELQEMYCTMQVDRQSLVGSGNGLRKNPALQNVARDAFGVPLRIPVHTEEAAYGAALYALVASGYCQSAAQAQKLIQFQ